MSNTVYDADFLRSLPEVLKNDDTMRSVASAIADELQLLFVSTDAAAIYTAIDSLPEEILNVLAYDFKVDWWDDCFTLEEKRATLKNSWNVHRTLGTPYAVERALQAIYPDTAVREWFDYEGDPYHFKLQIPVDIAALDLTKHEKVLGLVAYYKNLRSVLDEVEYYASGGAAAAYAVAAIVGSETVVSATAHNY